MAVKFPTPVAKYYWPFAVGAKRARNRRNVLTIILAGITYFLVYKASVASMNSDEFINDPRHPRFANGGKFIDLDKRD